MAFQLIRSAIFTIAYIELLLFLMIKNIFFLSLLVLFLSCSKSNKPSVSIFNPDSLTTQRFEIDVTRDTNFITANGALITIEKNTFQLKSGSAITLYVKEAYSMEDIIRGGLITKAGDELLSSDGMIYIGADNMENIVISKPITVSIPTSDFNYSMNLFKGKITSDNRIDWENPLPIENLKEEKFQKGKVLFQSCQACHAIGSVVVGPDLAYIGKRRPKEWLADFTRNSQKVIAGSGSQNRVMHCYSIALYNQYNKTQMTSFLYSPEEMKELYDYIDYYSEKNDTPFPKDELYLCTQKCEKYFTLMSKLMRKKNELMSRKEKMAKENGSFVREVTQLTTALSTTITTTNSRSNFNLISPLPNPPALYYTIKVNTFGWYNIDLYLKMFDDIFKSSLLVQLADEYKEKIQLFFVLPSHKVYAPGGFLDDNKGYGFGEKDGSILLPQNKRAYVYAVGEADGGLIYADTSFITSNKIQFILQPKKISLKDFNERIKFIAGDALSVEAEKTKNAEAIRNIEKKLDKIDEMIKDAEKLKPVGCTCDCGVSEVMSDSTSVQ